MNSLGFDKSEKDTKAFAKDAAKMVQK